jgi:predicted AAA+ superfamily ATPase
MPRWLYFEGFFSQVQDTAARRALILMGPRRVGKTVMMQHAIQALLEQGVPATSLFFVGKGIELNFYPAALYTYVIGANTLSRRES